MKSLVLENPIPQMVRLPGVWLRPALCPMLRIVRATPGYPAPIRDPTKPCYICKDRLVDMRWLDKVRSRSPRNPVRADILSLYKRPPNVLEFRGSHQIFFIRKQEQIAYL